MKRRSFLATGLLPLAFPTLSLGKEEETVIKRREATRAAAAQMSDAATWLFNALSPELQKKIQIPFEDKERQNWHYVPKDRPGVRLDSLNITQQNLFYGLLNSGLSHQGSLKATTIMSLEEVLFQLESAANPDRTDAIREFRNPGKYHVSIFGTPSRDGSKGAWGWRIEGHHISLNFTLKDGYVLHEAPFFFGINPATVLEGPRAGQRPLQGEEESARAFLNSLDDSQRKIAVVASECPGEILSRTIAETKPLEPAGISQDALNPEQKEKLHTVLKQYLFNMRRDVARVRWQEILEQGQLTFAWAGQFEHRQPHYYRIQSPSFLLEYVNIQNGANHIHSVWRNFNHDFARGLL